MIEKQLNFHTLSLLTIQNCKQIAENVNNFLLPRFLFDIESELYRNYRLKVESLRKGFIEESTSRKAEEANRKRKSRWGDESEKVNIAQPGVLPVSQLLPGGSNNQTQRNPQLIQYAIQVFGSTDLEDSQWKQCEDQLKVSLNYFEAPKLINISFHVKYFQMNQVYQQLLVKKKQAEVMAQQGKNKYEYDSDEDTEVCDSQ